MQSITRIQKIDVILGGGKRFWSDSLIIEYEKSGAQFIDDINAPIDRNKRLLGLFENGPLNKVIDKRSPSTTEMARLAITHLENNPNGFFVMIEESQVDWGCHANSAEYIKGEIPMRIKLNLSVVFAQLHSLPCYQCCNLLNIIIFLNCC